MASTIKVDNVQNQPGTNIINKCGTTVTVGACGNTVNICGASVVATGNVVKSNALQASDAGNIISQSGTDITLGATGDTINLASGASQSGFGRTGTVDWVTTPKVTGDSPVTGVSGNGYFMNTTAGAITINLPAGSAGDIISVADYAATWQTNGLSVAPNGTDKIGGVNGPVGLSTEGQSVTLVYVDSTQGWVNTMDSTSNVRASTFILATGGTPLTCGDYKTHVFTGPGTFAVTSAGTPAGSDTVEYLNIAGAGGGATAYGGGGGGAGGYRQNYPSPSVAGLAVTAQGYAVTVGAGGSASAVGNNSVFSTITSTAGAPGSSAAGVAGGSGGGAGGAHAGNPSPHTFPGGAGNTPPVSPPQGSNGGDGSFGGGYKGGGGGGASAVGGNCIGPGGAGSPIADAFIGTTAPTYGTPGPSTGRYFSGGGGGGSLQPASGSGSGGAGGGGAGLSSDGGGGGTATAGGVNTGGGGGNGSGYPGAITGGAGGSGIVIIRYKFQ